MGTDLLERKVRSHDPETSWGAAVIGRSAEVSVLELVEFILARAEALTDEQIFDRYQRAGGKRTPQRVRTARAQLTHEGIVIASRLPLGITTSGNPTQKWELA